MLATEVAFGIEEDIIKHDIFELQTNPSDCSCAKLQTLLSCDTRDCPNSFSEKRRSPLGMLITLGLLWNPNPLLQTDIRMNCRNGEF